MSRQVGVEEHPNRSGHAPDPPRPIVDITKTLAAAATPRNRRGVTEDLPRPEAPLPRPQDPEANQSRQLKNQRNPGVDRAPHPLPRTKQACKRSSSRVSLTWIEKKTMTLRTV